MFKNISDIVQIYGELIQSEENYYSNHNYIGKSSNYIIKISNKLNISYIVPRINNGLEK